MNFLPNTVLGYWLYRFLWGVHCDNLDGIIFG
jgi:hypothetical protein